MEQKIDSSDFLINIIQKFCTYKIHRIILSLNSMRLLDSVYPCESVFVESDSQSEFCEARTCPHHTSLHRG